MRRRDLLKLTFTAAPILLLPASSALPQRKRYAMLIDVERCYGCMACVAACAAENNVPIGVFRTWVERYVRKDGNVVFVPKQCNHCENPPCVKPCPTGATFKREDGLVLINDEICIGCGACIQACPYGARFPNPVKGVADKCTFCEHRLANGLLPACVEACPTTARIFGDLNDSESEISKIVESSNVQVLKVWAHTEPKIYYKSLPTEADI
ncbi:MAG: 4Fe-4S dicluster domain-containing protein [Nitrososphaerales archaeon]